MATASQVVSRVNVATPARTAVKARARAGSRNAAREIQFVQDVDNSRVRRVADPREFRNVLFCIAIVTLLFAAGLAFAWEQFAIIQDGYQIADLQGKRESLIEANKVLRAQVAALRSPERIATYASSHLGMTQPVEGQVVRLQNPTPSDAEPVMAKLR